MPAFFLQHATAGVLALLGLAVPVAIYLWNRRPGRVVQVGSLRWLETGANRRLRSLKPEGLLLLLVRAAIVGLLALALAYPSWQAAAPAPRGQVLLSPDASAEALSSLQPTIDSLRRRGYELRELRPRLPLLSAEAWTARLRATPPDSVLATDDGVPNVWAQVRQAADSFPNRPLVVVAPLLMRNFRGTRPALPANVTWHPVPPSTDSATWLLAAYQPHPDSIVLVLAHGSETAVRVRPLRLRRPLAETILPILPAPTQVTYQPKAGQPCIWVTTGSTTHIVPVQATTPRWWVSYDAAHAPDARVLGAALQAAGSVAPIRPRLTVSTQLPPLTDSLTWLFWLRDAPVPAAWRQRVQQGMRLWQDAPAPGASVSTTLPFSSIQPPVRLLRHDTLPLHTSAWALWTDAHGSPALSVQAVGRGLLYHLHTRLAPTWSELADSPELPSQLLPLVLAPPATSTNSLDPRQLDPTQLSGNQLTPSSVVAVSSAQSGPVHDSTPLVVLAAGLLFAVERWLATRRLAQSSASSVPAA